VTDRIAVILALLIVLAILADVVLNNSLATMFLLHRLSDLVTYVMIWR
jgi:uncharacterized membrane protein YobD (UPF0266 family)